MQLLYRKVNCLALTLLVMVELYCHSSQVVTVIVNKQLSKNGFQHCHYCPAVVKFVANASFSTPPLSPPMTALSMDTHVPAPPGQHAARRQPEQPDPSGGVPPPCAAPLSSASSGPQAGAPSAALQLETPAELPSASEPPPCPVSAQPARQRTVIVTKLKRHNGRG